jgi:hypothetical protein
MTYTSNKDTTNWSQPDSEVRETTPQESIMMEAKSGTDLQQKHRKSNKYNPSLPLLRGPNKHSPPKPLKLTFSYSLYQA